MKTKTIIKGIMLILAAFAVILDASGAISVGILRIVVSALMICIVFKSFITLNFAGILIPTSVIGIMFDRELGIEKFSPFPILVCAILASVGLSLIFGAAPLKKAGISQGHQRLPEDDGDSHIVISGKMISSTKYLSSEALETVTVSVKASNVVLYFDKAEIKGDEAVISIDLFCSNLSMYVPSRWLLVDAMTDKNMSNVEFCNASQYGENAKRLVLTGSAKMSNFEVVYI